MSCNKEKGEGKGREKGKNECSKNICNNQKFTLVLILKFKSGKTQKLQSHFISKSSQEGCDLPNEKQFKRARKKLLDKWTKSQKIKRTTKTTDTLTGIDTQIIHNIQEPGCTYCNLSTDTYFKCGCCNGEPDKTCSEGGCGSC
jgi:hypothetical protein